MCWLLTLCRSPRDPSARAVDNFISMMKPAPNPDGKLGITFCMGDKKCAPLFSSPPLAPRRSWQRRGVRRRGRKTPRRRRAASRRASLAPLPPHRLPGVAVQDIGRAAAACFADPSTIGKTVGVAGDHLTGDEYAAVFTKVRRGALVQGKEPAGAGYDLAEGVRAASSPTSATPGLQVTGKPHVYNNVPPEVYRGFGFPGCDDLANMFQFKRDFDGLFRGARSLETSKKCAASARPWLAVWRYARAPRGRQEREKADLRRSVVARRMNPKLLSFEAWLEQNKAAFA